VGKVIRLTTVARPSDNQMTIAKKTRDMLLPTRRMLRAAGDKLVLIDEKVDKAPWPAKT
jgi:hypothetical protein